MMPEVEVGDHVMYVDQEDQAHSALVTAVWWNKEYTREAQEPAVNLVLVGNDPLKVDVYGREIARETSVLYMSNQPARGNYWCRPQDLPIPTQVRIHRADSVSSFPLPASPNFVVET